MVVLPDDCDGFLTVKVLKPLNRILHTRGFVTASLFVLIPLVGMVSLVIGLQCLAYSEYSLLHTGLRSSGRSRSLRVINSGEITTTSSNTQYITDLDIDQLPECAQDVIVTLFSVEDENDEPSCKGLLIRDDIILTSNVCSKATYTFDFPGVGVIDASPHTLLNAKIERKEGSSPLRFLEVNLPYHYQHQSTRVYLSMETNPTMNDETNSEDGDGREKAVIMTCGEKQQPIAHNFPVIEKMIPLKSLAEILGNDIPWEGK